jgi:transcriptional regulator with XRE-family HTH domain
MTEPKRTTGSIVRAAREALGWSQSELSRRAGVKQSTLSRIEGGADPILTTAAAIADALGLRLDDLRADRDSE